MHSTLILTVWLLFGQIPEDRPKPKSVNGAWTCPNGWVFVAAAKDVVSDFGKDGDCEKAPKPGEENPRARAASIYPHPPPPQHLAPVRLDLRFTVETKHWYGISREPLLGRIEIVQKRTKDGWYTNNFRDTDVNGRIVSTVDLDATWRNPTVLMLVWKDKQNLPLDQAVIEVPNDEFVKGGVIKRKVAFHER